MSPTGRCGSQREINREIARVATRAPMLTRERECELARRWLVERDQSALSDLVESHMRLVISMAMRFRGYGLPVGDLIQEGSLGLMQAAARFAAERGVRLATYASWWIRAAMQDFILRNWSIVRTGTTSAQKALFFNFRRLSARIAAATDGGPIDEGKSKIARALAVRIEDVESMEIRLMARDQSINAPLAENGSLELQDTLPDGRPSPEEFVIETRDSAARSRWLAAALAELPAREQRIIRERHLSDNVVTLDALGRVFGISKERVRQLEHRALEKLGALARNRVERGGANVVAN